MLSQFLIISPRNLFASLTWALVCLLLATSAAIGQAQIEDDAEFDRLAGRYWQILERRPRKGTAFDLWYRHYLQADRLDELEQRIEGAIESQPEAPEPQLLQGVFHERERRPAEALLAYEAAERRGPDDYYAPYCRGLVLFGQQQYSDASKALARALELEPPRNDLLDMVQILVRCQLRMADRDAARKTLADFSSAVSGDPYTLRRLADVVTTEGDVDWAIELWQRLAAEPQVEAEVRLSARIQIAQLHADRGQAKAAIEAFRDCLGQLRPDGWLARDVCGRIERTFLQDQNAAGLVEFWKQQQHRQPQDLQTLQQLARAMRTAGQTTEAMEVYRQAIELAPSHDDLRRAFIDVLLDVRELQEAIAQCETLLARSGTDTEILRMLGQLYLKAASEEEQDAAQAKAIETWQRIADARPSDPSAALLAAEACRHSARVPSALRNPSDRLRVTNSNERLLDAAEAFYREAVDRARAKDHRLAVPYLEHLGEFVHALERPESAVVVWQSISAPPHDSAELVLETAEIFLKYGHLPEAEKAARLAAEKDSGSFRAIGLVLDVVLKREDFEAAFSQLAQLQKAADTPGRQDEARRLFVQVCTAGKLAEREMTRLEQAVAVHEPAVEDLWLLGLMKSNAGQLDQAASVFEQAVERSGGSSGLLRDYADVLQRNRKFAEAIEQYERLIGLEPHRRLAHYRTLVKLQMQQGRYDQAHDLTDKLVELAPNDLATYQLRVELARWSGNRDAQVSLLRQAVRTMPRDVPLRQQLAHALADQGELDEALAELWRCWELSPGLPERVSLVASMSDLAEFSGSRQMLIDRLRAAESGQPRTVGICLAEVNRRLGEFAQARRTLTDLLVVDDRDVDVLRQLAALAAEEQDWATAISYQQQVVNLDGAWTNVVEWARYYSQSKRKEWLAESRERQRQLMRAWTATFREYRNRLQQAEPDEPDVQALRQELVNLNWARNKYHDKERLLDPDSTYQRRHGDVWYRLRLDFEILELASRGPLRADQLQRRLGDSIRRARTSPEHALANLCEKEFLEKKAVEGEERYIARLPADELLAVAVRDFGERMLGAEIELSDVELVKLERVVESAGEGKGDAKN